MESYVFPARASESVFCRDAINSTSCVSEHGFDPERENMPLSVLELRPNKSEEKTRHSVFATHDIPQLSYIGLEEFVHMVHLSPKPYELAMKMDGRYSNVFNEVTSRKLRTQVIASSAAGFGNSYGHRVSFVVDDTR